MPGTYPSGFGSPPVGSEERAQAPYVTAISKGAHAGPRDAFRGGELHAMPGCNKVAGGTHKPFASRTNRSGVPVPDLLNSTQHTRVVDDESSPWRGS